MLSTILTIALWQASAGAQSPEVLLDRYVATGDSAVLDLCRSRIAELPRTNQSRLLEAKVLIERWRVEYNTIRPHSSLGYRPPAPEVRPLERPASAALQQASRADPLTSESLS